MTLIARVSYFFLIALAVMLIVYSSVLYGLARHHLWHEFDQQLNSVLNVLVAAIEVESDDVKWEPTDHTVTLGSDNQPDDARWVVVNEAGTVIDQSSNLEGSPDGTIILNCARALSESGSLSNLHPEWRFLQRRLAAPMPKPVAERDVREHAVLIVTVARSTVRLNTNLRGLAVLVILLSATVWGIAAVGGRWFCRKALGPLETMVANVREMGIADPLRRLPVASTGDELSDLAQAFNELLDQLFQAYQRQERFAGDAAHQFRTPLTVLQGQIEVALRKPRSGPEYVETLSVLNSQVTELRQIVESLLFLARAEDESIAPPPAPVELSAWLRSYLSKWQSHSRFQDLCLRAEQRVLCDISETLLGQLLDNLVSNALKYSAAGSSVIVSLLRTNDRITIKVEDHGIGIAPEDVPLVFEPFFRSVSARRSGVAGTGLGLPLAARIARVLHGELTCTSRLNEGSCFTLYLPGQ